MQWWNKEQENADRDPGVGLIFAKNSFVPNGFTFRQGIYH